MEEDGKRSWLVQVAHHTGWNKTTILDAPTMERAALLNGWASEYAGGLAWNFDDADRWAFKQYILSQDGASYVVELLDYVGVVEHHNAVVGKGCAQGADGTVTETEAGTNMAVVRCADGITRTLAFPRRRGIHAPDLTGLENVTTGLHESRVDFQAMASALCDNLGHHGASVALGWMVANLFYPEVMRTLSRFPNLYLYGKTKSGKNVLARVLLDIAGLQEMRGISASSSWKMIRGQIAQTCGWPIWINEFDNDDPRQRDLQLLMRNMFDGEGLGRTNLKGDTELFTPRRGVLMTGEDLFGVDSDRNRYVCVFCREKGRRPDLFAQVLECSKTARQAFLVLVKHREALKEPFLTAQNWFERRFLDIKGGVVDSRQAFCWSVAMAGLKVATLHDAITAADGWSPDFLDAIGDIIGKYAVLRQESSILAKFWDAIQSLWASGKLPIEGNGAWARWVTRNVDGHSKAFIGVWFPHLCKMIQKELRMPSFNSTSYHDKVLSHLVEEPYYCGKVDGLSLGLRNKASLLLLDPTKGRTSHCYPTWLENLLNAQVNTDQSQ